MQSNCRKTCAAWKVSQMYRQDYYLAYLPEVHFISYFKELLAGVTDDLIIAHVSSTITKQKDTYNQHHSHFRNVCKIGMDSEDPKVSKLTRCSPDTHDYHLREVCSVTYFQF